MAGTDFSQIYDLFTMSVTDYKLIALYNASPTDFATYMSGFLIPAIEEFYNSDQNLGYSGTTFTETLTQKNINILMLLMKKRWLEKEIDSILQMNNLVQDRDFKTFSQSQNMTAKQNRYIMMMEEVSQKLVDYGLNTVDWATWFSGTFYVP